MRMRSAASRIIGFAGVQRSYRTRDSDRGSREGRSHIDILFGFLRQRMLSRKARTSKAAPQDMPTPRQGQRLERQSEGQRRYLPQLRRGSAGRSRRQPRHQDSASPNSLGSRRHSHGTNAIRGKYPCDGDGNRTRGKLLCNASESSVFQ